MTRRSRYRVPFRRRREGKTDYKARKGLVLSGKPRIVVRSSIKHIIAQIIVAKPHGDEVLVSAKSSELTKKYGYKAPTGNIPAAYLTGLLCGLKGKALGINEAILDIGLHTPSKGSRVFNVLKGFLDAEVDVPYSEKKLSEKGRIKGEHIAEYAKSLASNPENYQLKFSRYLKEKIAPENLPEHFSKVKDDILVSFSGGKKLNG